MCGYVHEYSFATVDALANPSIRKSRNEPLSVTMLMVFQYLMVIHQLITYGHTLLEYQKMSKDTRLGAVLVGQGISMVRARSSTVCG